MRFCETAGKITNKSGCGVCISLTDQPRSAQLCVGANCGPSPNVPRFALIFFCSGVFRSLEDERPNLINLDALAGQIPKAPSWYSGAGRTNFDK
jgi:hypothetical protein